MTYDWRVKQASQWTSPASQDLGVVNIGDETIAFFSDGRLGSNYTYGLYWPRHLYAQVVRELGAQGAKWVGVDVLFGERRRDYDRLLIPVPQKNQVLPSDTFFQYTLGELGNVVLGATTEVPPHRLFRIAAADLGDISVDTDADGVFRRIQPFKNYRIWHEEIRMEALLNGWNLDRAQVLSNALLVPKPDQTLARIPLEDGFFNPNVFKAKPGENPPPMEPAYQDLRVWHLGIVMAAKALGLDIEQARVELNRRRIVLPGTNGIERILPLDAKGCLLIDWTLPVNDKRLTQEAFEQVWAKDFTRQLGTNHAPRFKDKLVIIGSTATGNDLTDRGATPLEKHTFLTSNHWNVANSVLTGRFIQPASTAIAVLLILVFGGVSAWATIRLRPLGASGLVLLLGAGLWAASLWLFIWQRYWLPLVTPLASLAITHGVLLSYRAFFEQNERRRIRGIFAKIVSPDVVSELLQAEKLSMEGARREVTVFFADVRGFTEFIDSNHARAEEHLRQSKLQGAEADAWLDLQSREALQTVNLYLSTIAEIIKKHTGTLDKYIGDCVMAFWGAPIANEQHALSGVRAAIDAQRAIYRLNQQRFAENQNRELEKAGRAGRGEAPLPPLPLLTLGSGVNTGIVTVGLMGSDTTLFNYTVFGRDVNLASRLEAVSGRGRIVIGENTFEGLRRHDAVLAATCVELPPVTVKGFREPVKIFEVPWKETEPAANPAGPSAKQVANG